MNKLIGLGPSSMLGKMFGSASPKLTKEEVVLCNTILKSDHFQKRFQDKWILVDGYSADDAELVMSYGFKKVISVKELMSLETSASPWIGLDFYEGRTVKLKILRVRNKVLKRYGMTMEELKKELKFSAIIVACHTFKMLSFI